MTKTTPSTPKRNPAYRNPPEHTRFRKGQSGNPKGRPKGSRNFRTLIEDELEKTIEISENGKAVKLTKRQIIARKLVNEAATGNPRAWRELLPMISGSNDDETVEIDPVSAAMIASYLARYHRGEPGDDGDTGGEDAGGSEKCDEDNDEEEGEGDA